MLKAEQFIGRNGNPVMNHLVTNDQENNTIYFQSYDSIVAKLTGRRLTLGRDWDYSKTTMKHLCAFLDDYSTFKGYKGKDIRKAIESGLIEYDENMK